MKSVVSPQKNTNLGLDLHSSNPDPVNFFGAQSSLGGGHSFCLGGHKQSFGGHGSGMPPPPWRRVCTNSVKKRNIEKLCHQQREKRNTEQLCH